MTTTNITKIDEDTEVVVYSATDLQRFGVLVEATNLDGSVLYINLPRAVAGQLVNELKGLDLW